MTGPGREALVERLHLFADELRARGIPVSIGERIDAMRAVEDVALDSPHALHTALSATLVKRREHLAMFDEVYRLFFRMPGPLPVTGAAELDLDEALRAVLRDGSPELARLLAEQAVARFVPDEPGRRVAGVYYESRTVRGLGLDRAIAEVTAELGVEQEGAGDGAGGRGGGDGEGGRRGSGQGSGAAGATGAGRQLGLALQRDAVADRGEQVRRAVREVIRQRLIAQRGVADVAETLRTPLPSDVALGGASPAQAAEIERIMRELQRKLATAMMRRHRRKRGPLDVRATLRNSMATGGTPVKLVHKPPAPHKTQLYVLADVSGSVANFAAFSITLISGMAQVFSRLRTFAFVGNALEVTDLFRDLDHPAQVVDAINGLGGSRFLDASTDYGRSLRQFHASVAPQLGRRSTVLILGDGRGNYRPAEEPVLADLAARAGAVYWLNPERRSLWGSGDSLMPAYAPLCTEAISCRTLGDLRGFIDSLE